MVHGGLERLKAALIANSSMPEFTDIVKLRLFL